MSLLFVSCSSAPKRVMLVTDNTNLAYSRLEEADASIVSGKYDRAYNQLSSAFNLALSVDNPALLCKITLSGIVLKISNPELDKAQDESEGAVEQNESFLSVSKEELLVLAKKLAGRSSEQKNLSNLCSVYDVRIQLENEKNLSDGRISSENMKAYLSSLEKAKPALSKEPFYLAYLYRTFGDVCMAGGKYSDAQIYYSEAAKIHTKERYLMEIGLDWYCVARAYSQGGNKKAAVDAILTALKYDRDAENTRGIASDYMAYSRILLKGNVTKEEKALSDELCAWSEKILKAGKF
ncbi:hypothetical protein [uncultured Treponema sp.]|uniref:hypothetical protein n=1 Tax=uncultured Treponema sp. TaxID=162155 RepID=UPI0025D15784|nr:hypothetical protein [uncultured Treponema sp.]